MITKFKHSLVVLITGLSFIITNAQTPLEKLFRLEGSWSGEATLLFDGNTFNFTYYADFQKNEESSGMYMEERFSHPDLGSLKGYNLIGFNARDQKIHWFSVDNFGTCHDHFGYWKTDDHFYMETTEKHGGKKLEERIDLIFKSKDELFLHLIATVGGQLYQDVTVIFYRQNSTGSNNEKANDGKSSSKTPAGLQKETTDNSSFRVYPNPAKNMINFQLPGDILSDELKMSVFNTTGEKLDEVSVRSATTRFSVSGYKPGIYFFRIMNKEKLLHSGKFIVQ